MSKQNYVAIEPKHCGKCGRDYTPIAYSDECPHDKMDISQQKGLDRPELKKIIGTFTRNVIYTERQRKDDLLTPTEWSSQIFEHETWLKDKLLALIPEDLVAKLKQAVKDARDNKDIDLPEELYEVFCSIQNQAIIEAKKTSYTEMNEALIEQRRYFEDKLTEAKGVVKKQERESTASVFGYIEDMFPELRSSYWNTKRWLDFKNEQLG